MSCYIAHRIGNSIYFWHLLLFSQSTHNMGNDKSLWVKIKPESSSLNGRLFVNFFYLFYVGTCSQYLKFTFALGSGEYITQLPSACFSPALDILAPFAFLFLFHFHRVSAHVCEMQCLHSLRWSGSCTQYILMLLPPAPRLPFPFMSWALLLHEVHPFVSFYLGFIILYLTSLKWEILYGN